MKGAKTTTVPLGVAKALRVPFCTRKKQNGIRSGSSGGGFLEIENPAFTQPREIILSLTNGYKSEAVNAHNDYSSGLPSQDGAFWPWAPISASSEAL